MASRRDVAAGLAALGAGALVAVSLPPWGWWPLAFIGIALLDRLVAERPRRSRFARGWIFGVGWLAPGMGWMWFLSVPGYLAATAIFGCYLGAACAIAPGGRWRRLALPAALTVAEALRFCFPFGGVPLASLAISQAASPLAPVARLGGAVGITWLVFALGVALSAATERHWRPVVATVAVAAVVLVAAALAPKGHAIGSFRVALVQGGGPQGTHAIDTDPALVFQRHLDATKTLQGPLDLVVWPENVVDTPTFANSPERAEIAQQAARLDVPIAVGITEDGTDPGHFTNAQVVVLPDGTISSRYDKVRIVPFGEYLPLRSLLDRFVPGGLLSRDAEPGHGPAVLDLPTTKVGVVISWEVFFGGRGRDGVDHGATLILNPTNGSSYTGTVLQTQQIASSRLRAIEEGRWLVQVAPTGFSAFVTPAGHVLDRTSVSEEAVRVRTVQLRDGRTIYSRIGDLPIVALAALALAVAAFLARPRAGASSELEQDGDRPVVDELDGHLGAEPAGGHRRPEGTEPGDDGVDEGFGLFRAGGGDPAGPPPP